MSAGRKRDVRQLCGAGVLTLLAGCAAKGPPPVPALISPDCSFRSGTSCWKLGPRLPFRSVQPADSDPPGPPRPAVLVSRDTF
jgi:hypothetical protein